MPAVIPDTAAIIRFIARECGAIPRDVIPSDETKKLVSETLANPTVVTTLEEHNYRDGDLVMLTGANAVPATINGVAYAVTVKSATTFTIPVNVTTAGTAVGTCILTVPKRRIRIVFPAADYDAAGMERDKQRIREGLQRLFGDRMAQIAITFTGVGF